MIRPWAFEPIDVTLRRFKSDSVDLQTAYRRKQFFTPRSEARRIKNARARKRAGRAL